MSCITQGNLDMEIGDNMKEVKKYTQNGFDEVCEKVTEREKTDKDKNVNSEERQTKSSEKKEELSVKTSRIEQAFVNEKVHFAVCENVCSKKCKALHVNFDQHSNFNESKNDRLMPGCIVNLSTETIKQGASPGTQESALSDEVSFCCGSLNHKGVVSAKFSMLISFILLIVSVNKFFRSTEDDEGNTKILVFFGGVYALCYIHCARKLISGIHKELKHKFIAWIGFSILTTFFLFSGAIYVLIYYWDELINFQNDIFVNCQTLALIVFLALFGCILLYCTRIVLQLWNSMHFEEQSHNGSCFNLMRDFGALHAFSFNSFSRAAAH